VVWRQQTTNQHTISKTIGQQNRLEKSEWGSGSMLRLGGLPNGKSTQLHAPYRVLSARWRN